MTQDEARQFAAIPRKLLSVIFLLGISEKRGATYRGICAALGHNGVDSSNVRTLVREGIAQGLLGVSIPESGRSKLVVVVLTRQSQALIGTLRGHNDRA